MAVVCLKLSFWRRLIVAATLLLVAVPTHASSHFCWEKLCLKIKFFLLPFDPISGHGLPLRSHSSGTRTIGRTSLDEYFTRRRFLYLTTHNTHKRQISMPPLDSNPQSQQANGRRPMRYTTRPRASATENYSCCTLDFREYTRFTKV